MPPTTGFKVEQLNNYQAFLQFCKFQASTFDDQPHVQMFKYLSTKFKLTREERTWLTLVYMGYYDDGSCWAAWRVPGVRERKVMPPLHFTISQQRRNLFGGRLEQHWGALLGVRPTLVKWLAVPTWGALLAQLEAVYGNGRWASFTTAEMLVAMNAVDVQPDTYEIAGSSGPKAGLQFLGLPGTEEAAVWLHGAIKRNGVVVAPQVFESFLCNWSRMCKGQFYPGRNFDRQQGRIISAQRVTGVVYPEMWEARKALFPHAYLGELDGRVGVDKARCKVYATTGQVILR